MSAPSSTSGSLTSGSFATPPRATGRSPPPTLKSSDIRFEISVDDDDADDGGSFVTSSGGNTPSDPAAGCNGVTVPEGSNASHKVTPRVGRVTFSSPDTSPQGNQTFPPGGGGGGASPPPKQDNTRLRVEFIGMEDIEKNKQEVEKDLKRIQKREGSVIGVGRLHQPRMSLLGKPLNYRAHKRDARYRRTQARVYNFLERPKDWRAISYHLLV